MEFVGEREEKAVRDAAAELADAAEQRPEKRQKSDAPCSGTGFLDINADTVFVETLERKSDVVDSSCDMRNLGMELDLNVAPDDSNQMEIVKGDEMKRTRVIDLNVNASEDDNCLSVRTGFDLNCGVNEEVKDSNSEEVTVKVIDSSTGTSGVNVAPRDVLADSARTIDRVDTCGGVDEGGLAGPCAMEVIEYEGTPGSRSRGSGRKKRKAKDSAFQSILRRSTRTRRSTVSVEENASGAIDFDEMKDDLLTPGVSAMSEEKDTILGCEDSEERHYLTSQPQLPPSSKSPNLEGIPISDIFSVYSFLRAFSTSLFLSPFELDDFVVTLRCETPTLLFDCIHLSLLQTLKKHLVSLSDGNCESASTCLRSLNWSYLDMVTWPVFMVEYLLMHGCLLRPGFDLDRLKLLESDYYKQPASVKIEMLQLLCDDVSEVDIIILELNRRTLEIDSSIDFDQKSMFGTSRKRKVKMDVSGNSCSAADTEIVNETTDGNKTTDGNSDECCLCKMEGNLICCDGCPAAYHHKCVGIAIDLVPDGDWFCPECRIDYKKPWTRVGNAIRGADLLGVDPYYRHYYNSCGYLLVSGSGHEELPFRYYHRNDLVGVIEALKASHTFGSTLLSTITNLWDVSDEVKTDLGQKTESFSIDSIRKEHLPDCPLLPLHSALSETSVEIVEGKSFISTSSGNCCDVSETAVANNSMKTRNRIASSEGSAENSQANTGRGSAPSNADATENTPQIQHGTNYVNFYSFAQTAFSVSEALLRKSSDKIFEGSRSEEIISSQLKVISNVSTEFSWSNIRNLDVDAKKEKCGWCFTCRFPEDGCDCLFVIKDTDSFLNNFTSESLGICPKENSKGHFTDVVCHLICIEDRLHGLLSGPWLNSGFSDVWRKAVYEASDVASLKRLIVTLVSNLHIRALSAEWHKLVDNAKTMGSASHIVSSSLRASARRKRPPVSDSESKSLFNAATGLCLLWWRGGRISRELFNWKILPHSLASKAARQAGIKKIPGIVYSDNTEYTKRSRCIAWQAAVEAASTVERLALQVRELDANINWDAIEKTKLLSKMDKEFGKLMRSFKKVIVRQKSSDGKYLLDFGKRRFIPDVVKKHGSIVEESSSDRRKFWLEESYLPLHLFKAFEDKRIARKTNKTTSINLQECRKAFKKPQKNLGFSYLFSKAERSEVYQCGHCNKDVAVREAVTCHYCEGFFHKIHVRKFTAAKSTIICHKCLERTNLNTNIKKGRQKLQKGRKVSTFKRPTHSTISPRAGKLDKAGQSQSKNKTTGGVPLRRSARKAVFNFRRSEVIAQLKGKRAISRKGMGKKAKIAKKGRKPKRSTTTKKLKITWALKRKRTVVNYPYWLNGLWLSRKPNNTKVTQFGSKNLIMASDQLDATFAQPKCSLCHEAQFSSISNYICCETCGDWFHGDAFGFGAENIGYLIGFRCHKCRNRAPPVCHRVQGGSLDECQIESEHIPMALDQRTAALHDCKENVGGCQTVDGV